MSENKIAPWQLKQWQAMPLELKEIMSETRIQSWHDQCFGEMYVAFSGGKDSTALLHLVRRHYPDTPAVFVDTGLEYPEIREFVKTVPNVEWLKPAMPFSRVVRKYGYPVVSKRQARYIHDVQHQSSRNQATVHLRLTGQNRKGTYCPSMRISQKHLYLIDAPFSVSDYCCTIMKKQPLSQYAKRTGRKPLIGDLACESIMRLKEFYRRGCNDWACKSNPASRPLSFWREEDIWKYLKIHNVPYSGIYDMGESRTGCMFCMFGVHLETQPNRFQRMKNTHPAQYRHCMDMLGCGRVLD